MLNAIVSTVPVLAFAFRIACRSEPAPLSFVLVTTSVGAPAVTVCTAENSDVLPSNSAVAVTTVIPLGSGHDGRERRRCPAPSGRDVHEPKRRRPLAEARRIAGGVAEYLDPERRVGETVQRALNRDRCAVIDGRRQHREVLEVVGSEIGVAGIVGCHAPGSEIDSDQTIAGDGVARNTVAGACRDIDAAATVESDRVGRARCGPHNQRVGRTVDVYPAARICQLPNPGGTRANEVSDNRVVGRQRPG